MGRKKLVRKAEPLSKRGIAWPRWTGLRGKTAWDWMQLLIVPLVLTVLALSFTVAQQVIANLQDEVRQQEIEAQRARFELALAEQQAQNEAVQAYLDLMKELLLEQDLRDSGPDSSARAIANVQTSLILEQVGATHKRSILRLLTDSHLIDADAPLIETSTLSLRRAKVAGMDLSDTDLSRATLEDAHLERANLRYAFLDDANLQRADLSGANLIGADLSEADLSRADLGSADFSGADLSRAWLYQADLKEADLSEADLSRADLSGTRLSGADLSGADLNDADLEVAIIKDAIIADEQLDQAASLEGATMPNGQKYEDWLKSKDQGENGKSGGSS